MALLLNGNTCEEGRKKHVLRDSAFCCANHMLLLNENGEDMTLRLVDRWLRVLEGRPTPVMESIPKLSVARAIKILREGSQVWESFMAL